MNLRTLNRIFFTFLSVLIIISCSTPTEARPTASPVIIAGTTLPREDQFLTNRLDAGLKSRVLTEEGTRLYNLLVKERKEYTRIPQIKEYFEIALLFDPENADAKKYIDTLDDLRIFMHSENLKSARKLLALEKPTETEEYRLLKATQNAVFYDPDSPEAAELYKQVQVRREAVIKKLLEKTDAALAKARSSKVPSEQEDAYIEAFQTSVQALAIAPDHQKASGVKSTLRNEISTILGKRIEGVNQTIGAGKYRDAEKSIESLLDLNKKLESEFDRELNETRYNLYYSWAESLFGRKEYSDSAAKARLSLGFRRSKEALAIIDKVNSQKSSSDQESGFDTGLKKLDDLVAQADISGAMPLIRSLGRLASTPAQKKAIDSRRAKLAEQLPDLYAKGIAAYKSENLAKAIELLELVVLMDENFKDAQDYLEKAKNKKKLLDQY